MTKTSTKTLDREFSSSNSPNYARFQNDKPIFIAINHNPSESRKKRKLGMKTQSFLFAW